MLIVGLGNPGVDYENTRHNVGFWVVDALADHFKVRFTVSRHSAKMASFSFKGDTHYLMKPQTFMNLSGDAIHSFLATEKLSSGEVLIIVDDINLPVGKLRLRPMGSSGGHNGLKSVIGYLGEDFWRLRLGVGKPQGSDLVNHVLDEVSSEERRILREVIADLPGLAIMMIMGNGARAMSRYNCRNYLPPDPPKN